MNKMQASIFKYSTFITSNLMHLVLGITSNISEIIFVDFYSVITERISVPNTFRNYGLLYEIV